MPDDLTDLEALERFVVENDQLLDLEARIGKFNVFDALGIVNAEIRHSNFLAWLLDPGESHGLGGLFLNAVLMDLLRQTPVEQRLFSPIKLDGGELRGVEVRREWRNIDLLIRCDDPPFVIAIENKVGSGEHSGQLKRYRETIEKTAEFADCRKQYVFLTPAGDLPSESDWTVYSYADLHRVLTRVQRANEEQIGGDVLTFLEHYLRLIGSRFMDDEKLAELCREIYKNHRQAIDLVVAHAAEGPLGFAEAIVTIDEHPDWVVQSRGKNSVGLQLAEYEGKKSLWSTTAGGKERPWVASYLEWWDDQCRWMCHVGPQADLETRRTLIEALRDAGDDLGFKKGGKITPEWTRLANVRVAGWKNKPIEVEALASKLKALLDDRAPKLRKAMEIVEAVTRKSGSE